MQRSNELDLFLEEYRQSLSGDVVPESRETDLLRRFHRIQDHRESRLWSFAAVLVLCVVTGLLFRFQQSVRPMPNQVVEGTHQQKEMVTGFIPLFDNQALTPARMVRVRLNSDTLLQLGLPFDEQKNAAEGLLADVVLSEEGLPQAIRFVRRTEVAR